MFVCVCAYKFQQVCNLWAHFIVKVWSDWSKVNKRKNSVPGCIRLTGSLQNLNNGQVCLVCGHRHTLQSILYENPVSNLWVLRFDCGCPPSMTNLSIFTWASRLLYHETVQLFCVHYHQQGSAKQRWSKRGFKSSREPESEASGVPKQANRLAVTCGNWITCRLGISR